MLELAFGAARGPAAAEIGSLTWLLVVMGGAIFIMFCALFVRGLLRDREGGETHESRLILWGGVVVPAVVVSVVLGATLLTMRDLPAEAGEGALVIEITGHQWWWEIYYPKHDIRSANEINIPVGRPVELRLTSADVIHSFWVPSLAGKIDLLPEGVNEMVLEASEPGVYRGVCAEFCGLQHAKMAFHVVAATEAEHEAWLARSSEPPGAPTEGSRAARGREVFFEQGCQECHAIAGTDATAREAPDLSHVAGRQSIAAGTLENTSENLSDWVSNPQGLKTGVAMPDLELRDDDIEALVAYLETLE